MGIVIEYILYKAKTVFHSPLTMLQQKARESRLGMDVSVVLQPRVGVRRFSRESGSRTEAFEFYLCCLLYFAAVQTCF